MSCLAMSRRGILLLPLLLALVPPARAGTLVEKAYESRTYLYFKIADETAQSILPAGWQPVAVPHGPAKGAKLILVLIERFLATDADDRPLDSAANRLLVVVVPGCEATGVGGPVVVGGVSAVSAGAPGAYRTYVAGKVELVRHSRDGVVDEDWEAGPPSGDRLSLGLSYVQGCADRPDLRPAHLLRG
jgi:hypothetical protein